MRPLLLLLLFVRFNTACVAQPYLEPLQLSVLPEQYAPFSESVSATLYTPQAGKRMADANFDLRTYERPSLGFRASGDQPLNRNLGFNNPIPAWILYGDNQRINFDGIDRPAYRPDAHGVMPTSIQGTYLDAQDMQRDPIPPKE